MSGASGKNKSTVSPCNLFSPPHKAHILITFNRLLFSCSRPVGNKQRWIPNAKLWNFCRCKLPYTCQSAQNQQLPGLLWFLAMVRLRIPRRRHREPRPYMCMKERCYGSNNKAQRPVIRSGCLGKIRVENREIRTPNSSCWNILFAAVFQAQGYSFDFW